MGKKMFLCVVLLLSLVFIVYAEGPMVITNQDLEHKYGSGGSVAAGSPSASGENCVVINYNSYDDMKRTAKPAFINRGSGIVTGGEVIDHKTATYLSVTVRNNTSRMQRLDTRDIQVYTIKGNAMTPVAGKTEYINAGATVTITGLKFNPISEVAGIKVSCY